MASPRRIAIALEIDQPYPHHQEVFAGIQEYAREQSDWECLIDEHPAYQPRRRGATYKAYDGVIGRASAQMQRRLKRAGTPFVNTHFQASRPGVAGVYADPQVMGRLAAEHLIERGFRRLSVLFDPDHRHTSEMVKGFLSCAQTHDIPCSQELFSERSYLDPDYWVSLERYLLDLLDRLQTPVGMFIETSGIARMLIQLGEVNGWHIPQDIAVFARENASAVLEVSPQITSLDDNSRLIGYEAARLLDRLMSGMPVPDHPTLVPPRGVIARESTDYFAVEDEVVAEALRYISANLTKPLRVEGIADAIVVSPRSLQKRFSDALGRGISKEVRRLRLEMAKRLLAEPDHSIGHIADVTGFSSSDLLNQVFRRELGMTPSAYRKKILSGQS